MAAGALLVREAGGFVSTADGGDDLVGAGSILAGNEHMHRTLLDILRRVR